MSIEIRRKKWPRKNLGELLNFIEEQYPDGYSLYDIAEKMHMERGGVSNMFRRDDMKLSKAESIAAAYGYRLKLFFPVRRLDDGYVPRPPRIRYDNAGNLEGLVKYIQDSEYSINVVAEHAHMSPHVLGRAFRSGDIKISTLNMLMDALGMCVIWKFIKNDSDNEN